MNNLMKKALSHGLALVLIIGVVAVVGVFMMGNTNSSPTGFVTASKWYECNDPDAQTQFDKNSLLTKSTTTFSGGSKTDQCYTWNKGKPNEKTRLIEGTCKQTPPGLKFNYWYADCDVAFGKGVKCEEGACIQSSEQCSPLTQGTPDKNFCDFPSIFTNENGFNGLLVYGINSPAHDILAGNDIASLINSFIYPPHQVYFDQIKLDAEITDPLANNLIVVGHPCSNNLFQHFCMECNEQNDNYLSEQLKGYATIKLVPNGDNYAFLVMGGGAHDTRIASKLLFSWKSKIAEECNKNPLFQQAKEICVDTSKGKENINFYPGPCQ